MTFSREELTKDLMRWTKMPRATFEVIPTGQLDFIHTCCIASNIDYMAVTSAAFVWWLGKCPSDWTRKDFFEDPTINCTAHGEKELARAVYAMAERIQNRG